MRTAIWYGIGAGALALLLINVADAGTATVDGEQYCNVRDVFYDEQGRVVVAIGTWEEYFNSGRQEDVHRVYFANGTPFTFTYEDAIATCDTEQAASAD